MAVRSERHQREDASEEAHWVLLMTTWGTEAGVGHTVFKWKRYFHGYRETLLTVTSCSFCHHQYFLCLSCGPSEHLTSPGGTLATETWTECVHDRPPPLSSVSWKLCRPRLLRHWTTTPKRGRVSVQSTAVWRRETYDYKTTTTSDCYHCQALL